MSSNTLVLFGYDFSHLKTKLGMQLISLYSEHNIVVIGAPWVKLNIKRSSIRTQTNEVEYLHPYEIAKKNNWDYYQQGHNSQETEYLLTKINPKLGIILGSRILSESIVKKFKMGIINFHPGVLPQNRGLDTIQNAIIKNLPQGVTAHLIDATIDQGKGIQLELLELGLDDTFFDIEKKIMNLEMSLLKNLLMSKFNVENLIDLKSKNEINKPLSLDQEQKTIDIFENYKIDYSKILSAYKKENLFL